MTERPNVYWRDVVRQGFSRFHATTADPDADFLLYIEDLYRAEKEREAARGTDTVAAPNLALYTLAVALLTYGRLDVIGDLLRNLPPERHPARSLASSISHLLPIDIHRQALSNPTAILQWIDDHRSRLLWSAQAGRFVLDDVPR